MSIENPSTIALDPECRFCHRTVPITVSMDAFEKWQDGVLVQDAMPALTAGQREMLITGTCDQCWNKMMVPDEEYKFKD